MRYDKEMEEYNKAREQHEKQHEEFNRWDSAGSYVGLFTTRIFFSNRMEMRRVQYDVETHI